MKISQRKCNKRAEIWAYLSSKTWKNLKRNPKFILKKMIDEYVHLYYDLRECIKIINIVMIQGYCWVLLVSAISAMFIEVGVSQTKCFLMTVFPK